MNLNLRSPYRAGTNLLKILPKLRQIAGEIRRKHGIEMLAIGKESVAVRIAELTAGAEAVLFDSQRVADVKEVVFVRVAINVPAKS